MMKNLLDLLILCGVLRQVILASIADEDIRKQSNVHVRHKRVFYSNVTRDVSVTVQQPPYVVNIKTKNGSYEANYCVGSILMAHVIITAAQCANLSIEKYIVYSASRYSHNGIYHSVIDKKIYISTPRQNSPHIAGDGIALMFVRPHFTISLSSPSSSTGAGFIALRHNRPIRPLAFGKISGWGYLCSEPVVPERIVLLQTITVRTMDNVDCAHRWQGMIHLSSRDICTYDAVKHCGHTDLGAPLVIDRQLVGVHIISGGLIPRSPPRPDIFAYLDHPEYFQWVRANIMAPTK